MYWNGMHLPFYRTKRLIKNLESTVGGDHSIENYVLDLDITYIIEESTPNQHVGIFYLIGSEYIENSWKFPIFL